jgi:hypothetical protein
MDSHSRRKAHGRLRLLLAVAAVAAVASSALPATASAAATRNNRSHCLLSLPFVGCVVPGIHLAPAALNGTAQEGQTLTCVGNIPGIISGLPRTYHFRRNGSNVQSGPGATRVLTSSDVGAVMTCVVQVTGSFNTPFGPINLGSISSDPSPGRGPVTSLPLNNVSPPTISGTAQEGQSLNCAAGSWSVTPQSSTLEWLVDGAPTGNAASPLVLNAGHVGKSVACRESVTRFERNNSATSAAVGPVTALPVTPGGGGNTGGGGTTGGGNTNTVGNTNTGGNTQGTTPTNNALARRRAILRRRAAAIRRCNRRFRRASQRKQRAACIRKARRRYRVR